MSNPRPPRSPGPPKRPARGAKIGGALQIGGAGFLGILLVLMLIFGAQIGGFYLDWLWFGELGQRSVLWKLLQMRWGLALGFGLAFAVLLISNLAIARKAIGEPLPLRNAPEWRYALEGVLRQAFPAAVAVITLVVGGIIGLIGAGSWDDWVLFRHGPQVGTADPVFKTDIGFYLFRLPFLLFLSGWLQTVLILVTLAVAVVYVLGMAVGIRDGRPHVAPGARTHLSLLLGLVLLSKAWSYWLDRYGLLLNQGGVIYGGGYADLHARLPALNILMVVAVIAAVGFFLNARLRAMWLPGLALALMVVADFTVGGLYPSLIQRVVVAPDEQARERPYIAHHLAATRAAYGLDAVQPQEYRSERPLSAADLTAEKPTLDNIRLWDYRQLGQTYQGLQSLRDYYDVSNVDIDRYTLGGKYRQVMLAPRELVSENLPNRRWVNETLQFTHGYGLVMSGVNEADEAGRPVWLARDLPLESPPELALKRPEIYFGLRTRHPIIAPSSTKEFDFQAETASSNSTYAGQGGIPLGGPLQRWLFGTLLGDWNIVISDQVKPDSRILIRREIGERVQALAPFLTFDRDPYLVAVDGRLMWVQDAYTTASTYPYSEPTPRNQVGLMGAALGGSIRDEEARGGDFNYLRNSVKATIDAYTGAVTFYAMSEDEPVLRAYRAAFPSLLRPASEMSADLRAHLRLPEDQFRLQARKLLRFHVTDPDVFFGRSDVWDVPQEKTGEQDGGTLQQMEPYYVVMRLPGEKKEEFTLILPFRTRAGTTMTAWLAGRCDGENYGQLRLYRFSSTTQVDAPDQVDKAISTDYDVTQNVALLSRGGSEARYGNLLVLPVGKSLLYVKPLYLVASQRDGQGGIPVFKRVILAEKRGSQVKVVMQPTLSAALAKLVGSTASAETPTTTEPPATGGTTTPTSVSALAAEADVAFQAAERAQRAGDWAGYGREMNRVRAAIQRLRGAAGTR